MVNSDVDGFGKTLNYRTIAKKQKTTESQKNTKTEVQAKWWSEF